MPVLEAIGTAVPGEPVPQRALRDKADEILTVLAPDLTRHLSVFDNAGIESRHFVRPVDWYLESRGWGESNRVYQEEGLKLLVAAASEALVGASVPADAVDGIVFVSTTGISTPSLDARLLNHLPGLRPDVQRVPVWGQGCAGGVSGLNLAADLARANPDKRYLLLSLELCSLAFHLNDLSVRAFVATTLFSDGCAAALVRGDELDGATLGRLRTGRSHAYPDSEDVMGWAIEDDGMFVVFSRRIPDIVERQFGSVAWDYVKAQGGRVDRHVFHPGGTKVLEAYEKALDEPAETFRVSRDTMLRYGNMSSPTVLFALKESLRRAPLKKGETVLLAALGPAFAAELGMLEG